MPLRAQCAAGARASGSASADVAEERSADSEARILRVQHQVLLSGERAVFVASFSPVAGAGLERETGVGSETGFGLEATLGSGP